MEYSISLCTVCMNRLHHLKYTLPRNIQDNMHYPRVEFVLLDYNSQDGLADWVKDNLMPYIEQGKLAYYRTTEPDHFDRSHSKNVAHRIASGDILCNLDADNYTGKGFADYVCRKFSENPHTYLVPDQKLLDGDWGAFGRICLKKADFNALRGYDESFTGWGLEDTDFLYRLKGLGLEEAYIEDPRFLQQMEHGVEDRVQNEETFSRIHAYYAHQQGANVEGIFLFNDGTFERGVVVMNRELIKQAWGFDGAIYELSGTIRKGHWKTLDTGLQLNYQDESPTEELSFLGGGEDMLIAKSGGDAGLFMKIARAELLAETVQAYSFAKNYAKFSENQSRRDTVVNPDGFGLGTLEKNFGLFQTI